MKYLHPLNLFLYQHYQVVTIFSENGKYFGFEFHTLREFTLQNTSQRSFWIHKSHEYILGVTKISWNSLMVRIHCWYFLFPNLHWIACYAIDCSTVSWISKDYTVIISKYSWPQNPLVNLAKVELSMSLILIFKGKLITEEVVVLHWL